MPFKNVLNAKFREIFSVNLAILADNCAKFTPKFTQKYAKFCPNLRRNFTFIMLPFKNAVFCDKFRIVSCKVNISNPLFLAQKV